MAGRNIGIGVGLNHSITADSPPGTPPVNYFDDFNRANSSTTLGPKWNVRQGTWGIDTNKARCFTSANGDHVLANVTMSRNFTFSADVSGTFSTAPANYTSPNLVFRIADLANYIYVRYVGNAANNVELVFVTAGIPNVRGQASFTFTDNVPATVLVSCVGANVTISINAVQQITYNMTALEQSIYLTLVYVGMLNQQAGTPAFTSRWDNFLITQL